MAKGGNTIFIKLESTGINPKTGKKTGYFYVTRKNPKSLNTANKKLTFRKYDPVLRQHVEFVETKLKS